MREVTGEIVVRCDGCQAICDEGNRRKDGQLKITYDKNSFAHPLGNTPDKLDLCDKCLDRVIEAVAAPKPRRKTAS